MKTKYIIPILGLFTLSSCSDKEGTIRALEMQGFTNIEIKGYNILGCDEKDFYHTSFRACKSTDQSSCITGVVCSGPFKGSTIRYN
jgi:hypothetical protein